MTDTDPILASSNTSSDDALDERQRHMLEAMGIKLWLPSGQDHQAAPVRVSASASAPAPQAAPMPTSRAAPSAISEQNRPLAGINTARNAIKNVVRSDQATEPSASSASSFAPISLAPRPAGIEQMDWTELQSAVSSCQACALCQSRKNAVFGIGQPPADAAQAPQTDWLIIGDPPDADEDAQGEPFAGQAGKLLDNMLAAMKMAPAEDGKAGGLSRKNSSNSGIYITNMLKCRPPVSRNPSPEEVAMCEPYLARQIELLRPKIILAMGKFAISSLTGSSEPLGKLRGRMHALKHASYAAPVIVTYHPVYLLRNTSDKAKAWADLLLAMQTYRELPTA